MRLLFSYALRMANDTILSYSHTRVIFNKEDEYSGSHGVSSRSFRIARSSQ